MKRSILFALAAPTLLAGCGGTPNRGLESVHQPIVARTDYVFDAQSGGYGLAAGEVERLSGWLAAMHPAYGDRIAVDDPSGGAAARELVSREVSRYGLFVDDQAPITAAPLQPGTVRIVLTRYSASVQGCPDYSRPANSEFNSNTSSNFGCAANANLAAMVANPADLVRGEPGADTADTATSFKAIDTYRQAKPTGAGGLKTESTK